MSLTCPHCGADISRRASFCRECGSDAKTGWSDDWEESYAEAPDTMEEDEYQDFLAREFPDQATPRSQRRSRWWVWVLLLVLLAFVLRYW